MGHLGLHMFFLFFFFNFDTTAFPMKVFVSSVKDECLKHLIFSLLPTLCAVYKWCNHLARSPACGRSWVHCRSGSVGWGAASGPCRRCRSRRFGSQRSRAGAPSTGPPQRTRRRWRCGRRSRSEQPRKSAEGVKRRETTMTGEKKKGPHGKWINGSDNK